MKAQHLETSNANWRGATWKLAAFACYAGLNGVAKTLSSQGAGLPVSEIVFLHDLIALLFLMPWMFRRLKIQKRLLPLHLIRVALSAAAIICWYATLRYVPLSNAVALSIIGPLIGVAGAQWLLKESMSVARAIFILVALAVAAFLTQAGSVRFENQTSLIGMAFLLASCTFFALAKIATRKLALSGESASTLTYSLFLFIVPMAFIPTSLNWVPPQVAQIPWLMLSGVLTLAAIYCVSKALVYAEVSFLAPFDICQFIFNAALGYLAFMELPEPWAVYLIAAIGVYLIIQPIRAARKGLVRLD